MRQVRVTVAGLDAERFAQNVAARSGHDHDPATSLCLACVDVLPVTGAGLVLMSGHRSLDFIAVSDAVSESVQEMEYALGEGPCVTAYLTKRPVFDPDLAGKGATEWPEFRRVALATGIHAAFGFPLCIGRICIGTLNLYNDRAGPLTDGQIADAVVVAEFATRAVLAWQGAAPPGVLAWQLKQARNHGVEVHQATGRISRQVEISVDDALVLLRAYAFSHDRPLGDVAREVASGHLRLD
jgi:GAF domain